MEQRIRRFLTRAPEIFGYVEVRSEPVATAKGFGAEVFGTALVVLVWTGMALASYKQQLASSNVELALAIGFVVAAMIWVTEYVSGGHLNPCVTFGLMFTGHVNPLKAVFFIVAQILGSIIGSGILIGLTARVEGVGSPDEFNVTTITPDPRVTVGQALGVEIMATLVIVLTAMTAKDEFREDARGLGPVAVGFAMTACQLAFAFYTVPCMNPARNFGPAVFTGNWNSHWVYWVGPFLGGFIAALLHLLIFKASRPPVLIEVEELAQLPGTAAEDEETPMVEIPLDRAPFAEEGSNEVFEITEVTGEAPPPGSSPNEGAVVEEPKEQPKEMIV